MYYSDKEITVEEILNYAMSNPHLGGIGAASHIHVWEKFLEKERGDTLELGGGGNSTPFISSRLKGHEFVTLESSKEWADRITESKWHIHPNHRCEYVPDWDKYDWSWVKTRRWKYIFIDHAPGNHRIKEVVRLLPYCDFLIIHDTEADRGAGAYGWSKVDWIPEYWVEYLASSNVPSTTVCSNYHNPELLVPKF